MSELLNAFDQFFFGERPYNGGAFGQQLGNESFRIIYTGSQRETLRERIEQLESQLASADGMEAAEKIANEVVASFNKEADADHQQMNYMHEAILLDRASGAFAVAEAIRKAKPEPIDAAIAKGK